MSAQGARGRVEAWRARILQRVEAGRSPAVSAECVNEAAADALAAIEAGDLELFAEAFEALALDYVLAVAPVFEQAAINYAAPLIEQDTIRTRQLKAARSSRSKPKQQARALWDSMERKPNGWKDLQRALTRESIECTDAQARRWYTEFQFPKLAQ
jgi:hypothetical protein